jgi:hypothetical protein
MIPADGKQYLEFFHELDCDICGRSRISRFRVLAWSAAGEPMVIGFDNRLADLKRLGGDV